MENPEKNIVKEQAIEFIKKFLPPGIPDAHGLLFDFERKYHFRPTNELEKCLSNYAELLEIALETHISKILDFEMMQAGELVLAYLNRAERDLKSGLSNDLKGRLGSITSRIISEAEKFSGGIFKKYDGYKRIASINEILGEAKGQPELVVQTGHFAGIASLAFSPNGQVVASGSYDSIKLWDVATGIELRTLTGHESKVYKIIFSQDGKILLGKSYKPDKFWNLFDGRELAPASMSNFTFNPNGEMSFSISDKTIKLHDFVTNQPLKTLTGHVFSVSSVVLSPDRKMLASGSRDKTVKLWDTTTGQELKTLIGHTAIVGLIAFSPDGKILASGCNDRIIRLWDPTTGQELRTLIGHSSFIAFFFFSPNGKLLVSGSSNKIKVWDTTTGQEVSAFKTSMEKSGTHYSTANSIAFSPNGEILAIGSEDLSVKIFDTATGQILRTLMGHTSKITSVALSPDGRILASGSSDLKFWDVATGRELRTLIGHNSLAYSIAFSQDGKILASGNRNGQIRLWNLETGRSLRTIIDRLDNIEAITFSSNGKTLVSAGAGRTVKFWDLETGQKMMTLKSAFVQKNLGFSRDEKLLASGNQARIEIWKVENGGFQEFRDSESVLRDFPTYFEPSDQSISDRFFAQVFTDGKIKLFDRITEKEVATLITFDQDEWLVTTPEGFFDGTPAACQKIIWRLDNNTFNYQPVEAYFEKFHRADLLHEIFARYFPPPEAKPELAAPKMEKTEVKIDREADLTQKKSDLESQIAEIDRLISLQLNEILHHEDFQRLEASWRGLHYLVNEARPNQHLKIKVWQATKKDLLKDFERTIEFDRSTLFKRVYEDIYGTFGEDPFGMLIGDYEFSNHPQDMALLDYLSQVAGCSHAPFVSAASPGMFGWDDFAEMYEISYVSKIFDQVEYAKWRSFRESEDSRSVGLCLPHILLREPDSQDSEGLFNFQELVVPKTLLWGNAAYAFGACVAKAYRESSWCGMMNGPQSDGLVEGLTGFEMNGFNQSIDILIEARREVELSALGFIPLVENLARNETSFFGAQSCSKPKLYDTEEANRNSRAISQLPNVIAKARFAHYLKVIVRDRPRSFANKEELQQELRRWLDQYTHYDATRSRYPLKQARIDVVELPNKPGELRGVAHLSPVYQIDELSVGQRIVFDIPKNQGNSVKSQPLSIPLEKISKRLFVSQLSEEFLRENKKFYLAIRSSLPENKLLENIHHLLKISSRKTIGKVLHFAAPGITFERVLPPNLSLADASFHYFLLWTPPILYWKLVEEEKQIAVNAAPDLEVLEIKLLGDQFGELPSTVETKGFVDYYLDLNLLDEPSLTLRDAGSSVHSYRFFWNPTFDTPRLFRITIEPDQTGNIVVKTYRCGVRGGQFYVNWTQNDTFQLSSEEVAWWLEVIESCGFWQMERGSRTGLEMDGTYWTIEGLKYGNYKELIRWSPQEPDILKLGAAFHKLGHSESVEITSELQRIADLPNNQGNSINQEFDQGVDIGHELVSNDSVKENEAIDSILIQLEQFHPTLYFGRIENERLLDEAEFYLAISAQTPESRLIKNVPLFVKIASRDVIDTVINSALPGVTLTHIGQPPPSIPNRVGFRYFSLETKGGYWEGIKGSKILAIRVPEPDHYFPDMQLELHAVLPDLKVEDSMRPQVEESKTEYLNGLEIAWQRAESEAEWSAGRQISCALEYLSILQSGHLSAETSKDQKIGDEEEQLNFLIALAMHLPVEENTALIDHALNLVKRLVDDKLQAEKLKELAPYLNARQREETSQRALDLAVSFDDKKNRLSVLADLASYLPPRYLAEALNSVQDITYQASKGGFLGRLAPYLPDELMPKLLAAVEAVENGYPRKDAVGKVAPSLSTVWLEKLLEITKSIEDSRYRADALRDLAKYLPAELMGTAFKVAETIPDVHYQAWAFGVLLADLPAQFVQPALDIIHLMKESPREWAESISYLAPHLAEEKLFSILEVLNRLEPGWTHVLILERIAPYFPPQRLNEAIHLIFEADERTIIRSELVRVLAPYLSEEILLQILDASRESSWTEHILRAIVPYLSPNHLPQVLAVAKAISFEHTRAQALCLMAEFLPQDLKEEAIPEALSAARSADAFQVRSLSAVVPYLSPQKQVELIDEIVSVSKKSFYGNDYFSWFGTELEPMIFDIAKLSDQGQAKLINVLVEISLNSESSHRLVKAWGKSDFSDPADKRSCWNFILRRHCQHLERSRLLENLSFMAPILVEICDQKEIDEIVRSIKNVGQCFP